MSHPPDPHAIADLLRERYAIDPSYGIEARTEPDPPKLAVRIDRPKKDRVDVEVTYLRGAGSRDRWDVLLDAADALIGTLVEADYAYRDLPQGPDTQYQGAIFHVEVACSRPDVDRRADQLLDGN